MIFIKLVSPEFQYFSRLTRFAGKFKVSIYESENAYCLIVLSSELVGTSISTRFEHR